MVYYLLGYIVLGICFMFAVDQRCIENGKPLPVATWLLTGAVWPLVVGTLLMGKLLKRISY